MQRRLLTLVCCQQDRGHVLGQYPDCECFYRACGTSGDSAGATMSTVTEQLKTLTLGQPILTITSAHPGLGKTELIRQHAHRKGLQLRTVPISGPIDDARLVVRLQQSDLHSAHQNINCALHLDISTVSNAPDLNIFVFQLLVFGSVSSGTHFFHVPSGISIYMEVANTLDNSLRCANLHLYTITIK